MQKINIKEETGFTRYITIGDLYRETEGKMPVGKARITFYVPRKKKEMKDKGKGKRSFEWLEHLSQMIEMDVLFFSDIEKGWVEGFVNGDDVLQEKVDAVEPDAMLIVNAINEYLADNGFGIWVR